MADSDDEYYEVPLKDQRYFGAGIKRKRVNFVPSSTLESTFPTAPKPSGQSVSERYLSIVLPKAASEPPLSQKGKENKESRICDVCKVPIEGDEAKHAGSVVHQIALPHSHPPSALDRKRKGMSILQAYGWDPDKRRGLGAQGEGILHPVKAKEKRDTVGLGVNFISEDNDKPRKRSKEKPKPVEKLDAGKIRKLEKENKKKDERLRNLFYASEDVEKYLGAA